MESPSISRVRRARTPSGKSIEELGGPPRKSVPVPTAEDIRRSSGALPALPTRPVASKPPSSRPPAPPPAEEEEEEEGEVSVEVLDIDELEELSVGEQEEQPASSSDDVVVSLRGPDEQDSSDYSSSSSSSSSENDELPSGVVDFSSQFDEGVLDLDDRTASEGEDDDLIHSSDEDGGEVFDGGFQDEGSEGDAVVPVFAIEDLEELGADTPEQQVEEHEEQDTSSARDRAWSAVDASNNATSPRTGLSMGDQKTMAPRHNVLDELRKLYKTTAVLKLSRDFSGQYLFKINADGYHLGYVREAGSDYDFYNTDGVILHTIEKVDMPQLDDPVLRGTVEPSFEVVQKVKKFYRQKADLIFISDVSKGFMFRVELRNGKHLGWAVKNGRDIAFHDRSGKNQLGLVPQSQYPTLAMGERDAMLEIRRVYKQKDGVRMKRLQSSKRFKYKVVTAAATKEKEKLVGWANISSGYFLFFDKDGKKRLHAVHMDEMPRKKKEWAGHGKGFGISKELTATSNQTYDADSAAKPMGIFGLMEQPEGSSSEEEPNASEADKTDKKKKKKKKKGKKSKKPRVRQVVRIGIGGFLTKNAK